MQVVFTIVSHCKWKKRQNFVIRTLRIYSGSLKIQCGQSRGKYDFNCNTVNLEDIKEWLYNELVRNQTLSDEDGREELNSGDREWMFGHKCSDGTVASY